MNYPKIRKPREEKKVEQKVKLYLAKKNGTETHKLRE